jgi:hypothetical protein
MPSSVKANLLDDGVVDAFVWGLRDEQLPYLRSAAFDSAHSSCGVSIAKAFAAGGMVKRGKWSSRTRLDEPIGPRGG